MRIPKHVGIIPDGNRRWALNNNLSKEEGYNNGLDAGLESYKLLKDLGVKEITYYGFTADNTKRPTVQRLAFTEACVNAVKTLENEDCDILVVGNSNSKMFPEELKKYISRKKGGNNNIKVNFLINYSWEWDLSLPNEGKKIINSHEISRIDLVIRWGGMRRLSGFLPVQSVYSDFYVVEDLWPNYSPSHIHDALNWYSKQDITLGG